MEAKSSLAHLAAGIVCSYVENNALPRPELPELIGSVYGALSKASRGGQEPAVEQAPPKPAVPVRRSVTEDHIVCLEDGLKFKSIKRHLASSHDMTPTQYRQRWGLSPDYPMTSPGYVKRRSELAKKAGLGQKGERRRKGKSKG